MGAPSRDPATGLREAAAETLGPRRAAGIEVAVDGGTVGARGADGIGAEALVAEGLPVFAIRGDQVGSGDVARGGEEGEANTAGDLQEGTVLDAGRADEAVEELRQFPGGRQAGRIVPELGKRRAKLAEFERREVDEVGGGAGGPFEGAEEGIDRLEVGAVGEDTCAGQLGFKRAKVGLRAVEDVARRSEEPEGRESEGGDGAELDSVAGSFLHGHAAGSLLGCGPGWLLCFDAADELDGYAEEVLRGDLIEARAADHAWQEQVGCLVHGAEDAGGKRANGAFGEGREEEKSLSTGHRGPAMVRDTIGS